MQGVGDLSADHGGKAACTFIVVSCNLKNQNQRNQSKIYK